MMTELNFDGIPQYLREQPRWTVWYVPEWSNGNEKPQKMLKLPNGQNLPAGYEITKNTGTFEQVKETCLKNKFFYPGFYIEEKDGLIFLDYDGDSKNVPNVPQIPTFCEKSVYGYGYHVIGWYKGNKPIIPPDDPIYTNEVYQKTRWCVMTGSVVDNRTDINDLTDFFNGYKHVDTSITISEPFKAPAEATPGDRHKTLKSMVASMVSKNYSFSAIMAACQAENLKINKPPKAQAQIEKEVTSLFEWASKKEQLKQLEKAQKTQKNNTTVERLDPSDLTEVVIAEQFVTSIQGEALYDINMKRWRVWNGKNWALDERNVVSGKARRFVKTLFYRISELHDDDVVNYVKYIRSINCKRGIDNIVALAAIQLTKKSEDFDKSLNLLNMKNGTLEFTPEGVNFKPHNKEDMISYIGNVDYKPEEPVPAVWLDHLKLVTGDDPELIDNLQSILGYTLEGGNRHEYLLLMHGGGRNGKSVTQRMISYILGDYAVSVNPLTLMEFGNKQISPERMMMRGKRFITAEEPNKQSTDDHKKDTAVLDTGFLKAASGHGTIPARFNYSNIIEDIRVVGLIAFVTNPLPKINDDSIAFWERLISIPFMYTIQEWERDPDIEIKFKAVASGILNWLIEGWKKSRNQRIKLCKVIKDDISLYRSSIDEYAYFCGVCVESTPHNNVSGKELYEAYVSFSRKRGISYTNETRFGNEMSKKYNKKRTNMGVFYTNIRLKDDQREIV